MTKDDAEAVKWFRKAAEQNLADAQYILGVCYDSGEGVAKDEIEAYKWWLLAAGHGNDDAKYNMTIVENKMTREQIAEGQSWRGISGHGRCHPKGAMRVCRRDLSALQPFT